MKSQNEACHEAYRIQGELIALLQPADSRANISVSEQLAGDGPGAFIVCADNGWMTKIDLVRIPYAKREEGETEGNREMEECGDFEDYKRR